MPSFRLIPFSSEPLVSALSLTGAVELGGAALRARYVLAGALDALAIPSPSAEPARRDGLWRTTCFELFVAPRNEARYLELNVSPSGDWNAYSFASYREGMAPLPVARFASHCTSRSATELELDLELDLELELGPEQSLGPSCELAVTAVLEHSTGARSYWALCHKGERPDFHLRESFTLRS